MKRKIIFVAVLVAVIVSIWYLETMKVNPAASGGSAAQTIAVSEDTSSTVLGGAVTASGTTATTTATPAQIAQAIKVIAARDRAAGDQPAIEIADPTGFVNATSGFRLANLIGKKVILLDFWTYSCINCIRTLPYLTSWYSRYANQGLEIVGIHTPEFDFEKQLSNVQAAVQKYGIHYPVVLDSNYGTWQAYGNLYWPHEYLIDLAGYIVHDQIGEGNYDETEMKIQQLLAERATALGIAPGVMPTSTVSVPSSVITGGPGSPETYFGAARNQYLANGTQGQTGDQTFAEPQSTGLNQLNLVGAWNFQPEYATNKTGGARIIYQYQAAKVYFVASASSSSTVPIQVLQDGKPVDAAAAGSDVKNGTLTVGASRLYNLINNPDGAGVHTLELIIGAPGLQAYTFTFG